MKYKKIILLCYFYLPQKTKTKKNLKYTIKVYFFFVFLPSGASEPRGKPLRGQTAAISVVSAAFYR